MPDATHKIPFSGRIVMIGSGSIGQGVIPLLRQHIDMPADRVQVISANAGGREVMESHGVGFLEQTLTPGNYQDVLKPQLEAGDFLLNLSVDVSSVALVELAQAAGALYLDTCIEPWLGGYTDAKLSPSLRSNYALRETALKLKGHGKPTAVLTHGANPGLVSHFAKRALLNIAQDTGFAVERPKTREDWAALARDLGIKVIHVAERDTQVSDRPKEVGEFVNTWSVDGFIGEGCQPAEMGWGTHEKILPEDGAHHAFGSDAAIYLNRPGASVRVRTWTPLEGAFHGFLITHNESISLADFLTLKDSQGVAAYRPTVHYAYHPCDAAVNSMHELAGKNWVAQERHRLIVDEVTSGIDELGVLLCGHAKNAYWYGSQLSIEEARDLAPHNNATSLQVTAPVLAGMIWAMENPDRGVVEPEEMDHERVLELAGPYLGPVVGAYGDWTPLEGRETLFPEDLDRDDPWQFKNVRVI